MRVVVNMYPVAAGGGLQNALSFLSELSESSRRNEVICLVRRGSPVECFCREKNIPCISFRMGFMGRLFFELFSARLSLSGFEFQSIFTLFGNPPLNFRRVPSVSGFARSNMIEGINDFWRGTSFFRATYRRAQEFFLLWLIRRSTVVILETERLGRIAKERGLFHRSRVEVVPMSPGALVLDKLSKIDPIDVSGNDFRILYLAGPHSNKRIEELSDFIFHLNSEGPRNFVLYTTLPSGGYLDRVVSAFEKLGLGDKLVNLGPIPVAEIPEAISRCHSMINFARLESFSNNWVEAWASGRLLIVPKEPYAEDSCGDAAFYIDQENFSESARNMIRIIDCDDIDTFVKNGRLKLTMLPSPKEKFLMYWGILENVSSKSH